MNNQASTRFDFSKPPSTPEGEILRHEAFGLTKASIHLLQLALVKAAAADGWQFNSDQNHFRVMVEGCIQSIEAMHRIIGDKP